MHPFECLLQKDISQLQLDISQGHKVGVFISAHLLVW